MEHHSFTFSDGNDRIGILLVDVPDFSSFQQVADLIYGSRTAESNASGILIIRPQPDRSLSTSEDLGQLAAPFCDRLPRASIHILYSENFRHVLSENLNTNTADLATRVNRDGGLLSWLRRTELVWALRSSNSLLDGKDAFQYRSPSGSYCDKFLRVGNMQLSRQVLDAVFFWMLPYLVNTNAILAETWSISSLALNSARLLERYRPSEGFRCWVDMLSTYHDGSADVFPETQDAIQRVLQGGDRKVLVLISAVATGRSFSELKKSVESLEEYQGQFSFLSLYNLVDGLEVPTLCDLSHEEIGWKFNITSSAAQPTTAVVPIDPHTYFPTHVREEFIDLSTSTAQKGKQFYTDYQGIGAFCVHRDSRDTYGTPIRHHGLYVDVEKLLSHEVFRQKWESLFLSLERAPSVLVTPQHPAGIALQKIAQSVITTKFGSSPEIVVHDDLYPQQDSAFHQVFEPLDENADIIIIDDVAITGTRLTQYQAHLRGVFKGRILFVVGVVRTESQSAHKALKRHLSYRSGYNRENWHRFIFAEEILLPNLDTDRCPWCQEEGLLRNLQKKFLDDQTLRQILMRRMQQLSRSRSEQGLESEVFWHFSPDQALTLTPNSIFLDHRNSSQSDLALAVGSALQHLREAGSHNSHLERGYPHATLLDSNDYLGNKFTDDIIRAAILRLADPKELACWEEEHESKRKELLNTLILRPESKVPPTDIRFQAMLMELATSSMLGKIPQRSLAGSDFDQLSQESYSPFLRLGFA